MVKALLNKTQARVYDIFPMLDFEENDVLIKKYYNLYGISVFDHYLTEQEAEKQIVLYKENFSEDANAEIIYKKYEMLLQGFYLYL